MQTARSYMFVDESGDSSLNRQTDLFLLGTVLIDKNDFDIVEGYLRLLKRRHFGDDYTLLHAVRLFETPGKDYPSIASKRKMNSFIGDLIHFFTVVPYAARMYAVNKPRLLKDLNYQPAPRKKVAGLNIDLPYERTSIRAIHDFAKLLETSDKTGEIVIESRLSKDTKFVGYFDTARQDQKKGSDEPDALAVTTRERVTSLSIANKLQGSAGLEIVDLCCYIEYRRLTGDPDNRLSVPMEALTTLSGVIKKHAYTQEVDRKPPLVVNI